LLEVFEGKGEGGLFVVADAALLVADMRQVGFNPLRKSHDRIINQLQVNLTRPLPQIRKSLVPVHFNRTRKVLPRLLILLLLQIHFAPVNEQIIIVRKQLESLVQLKIIFEYVRFGSRLGTGSASCWQGPLLSRLFSCIWG
jgi:hypothetical protein